MEILAGIVGLILIFAILAGGVNVFSLTRWSNHNEGNKYVPREYDSTWNDNDDIGYY